MVVSFQKVRTALAALANLVFIGGYFFLVSGGIIPESKLIGACVLVFAGLLMYMLPFFKKNRIAIRFDAWAFFLVFVPFLYVLLSATFEFPFDLDTYLPKIADFTELIYVFFGYVLGYVFFEHTTAEYEKGKAQERSAKRQARKERRRKNAKERSVKRQNKRQAEIDGKNAQKASKDAEKANKKAAAAKRKLAKSTKRAAKA